jgi:hypothetical protein
MTHIFDAAAISIRPAVMTPPFLHPQAANDLIGAVTSLEQAVALEPGTEATAIHCG